MVLSLALLALGALTSCSEPDQPLAIRLENRQPIDRLPSVEARPTLTISVGSMITPQDGYIYYRKLLDYLGRELGFNIKALDPENYSQVNQALEAGEVDAAFVCGGPYVEGHEQFGLELLAAPQVNGQPQYYSYLIVPVDSPARGYADLRGKTFAFADPESNSGMIAPSYALAQMGETPESFFSSYLFTYAHDRSILAVANKLVDGAAVDSLIWEYYFHTEPSLTQKTKIISKSPPFGIPPVVASPHLDQATKARVKSVLLDLHNRSEGRNILRGMHIERFVEISNDRYDSIRQMRQFLSRSPQGQKGRKP